MRKLGITDVSEDFRPPVTGGQPAWERGAVIGGYFGTGADDLGAQIEDHDIRRLYFYWLQKRGTRALPARTDIDVCDLSFILGWVNLIDVSHDPLRFRYRLHGTELVVLTECEMTGRFLDQHPSPDLGAALDRAWQEVVDRRQPTHRMHEQVLGDQLHKFETLRLPLASDGQTIDMLLIAARLRPETPADISFAPRKFLR